LGTTAIFTRSAQVGIAACFLTRICLATMVTISGTITQSVQDGTGPAVNNPGLNNILDNDPYSITLDFAGAILAPSPVPYDLTGAILSFQDPAQAAVETAFDSIFLTVSAAGAFDQISLLACVTSGSGCLSGNQLSANFEIPAAMLNAQNVPATGLDQPHPLDLLEDDGITDIQGSVTSWSSSAPTDVPEPGTLVPLICVLAAVVWKRKRKRM